MKRFLVSLLLVIFLSPIMPRLAAQDSDPTSETWHFAFSEDDSGSALIAFTLAGESHILITEGVERNPRNGKTWRLGPQLVVAVLTVHDVPGVYRLTPNEAVVLQPAFDTEDNDRWLPAFPIRYHGPYVVFATSTKLPAAPVLLANLETGTLEQLTGHVDFSRARPVFSADGSYLRYLSWDFDEEKDWKTEPWTIWERELATGAEQPIHHITGVQMNVTHNRHGEQWLHVYTDRDTRIQTYTVYHLDGTIEVLARFDLSEEPPQIAYQLFADHLMRFDPLCETDCTITFRPLTGDAPIQFIVPEKQPAFIPLHWLDDSRLLAMGQEAIWLLNGDGSSQLIGYWSPRHVFTPRETITSPDGQWVLALNEPDEPTQYIVFDTQTELVVVTGEIEVGAIVVYRAGGFFAADASLKNTVLYRNTDETIYELPPAERGEYQDVQPDGAVLYVQFLEVDLRQPGIYRYDPATDMFTLVHEAMESIALAEPYTLRD